MAGGPPAMDRVSGVAGGPPATARESRALPGIPTGSKADPCEWPQMTG